MFLKTNKKHLIGVYAQKKKKKRNKVLVARTYSSFALSVTLNVNASVSLVGIRGGNEKFKLGAFRVWLTRTESATFDLSIRTVMITPIWKTYEVSPVYTGI